MSPRRPWLSTILGKVMTLLVPIAIATIFSFGVVQHSPSIGIDEQSQSSTAYITLFDFKSIGLNTTPFVLFPLNDRTVWVIAVKFGPPFVSEIINFTIGAPPKIVFNTTASFSSIIADKHGRIWMAANTLIYYDTVNKKVVNSTAFGDGFPEYMAIDKSDHMWVTLVNANSIGMYDLTTNQTMTYPVPTPRAVLQGITVSSDGTIWFTEASARKLGHLDPKSCTPSSCRIDEYSPPSSINLIAPVQVTTDPSGKIWFTDHGTNQFGWLNAQTGSWLTLPIGYCKDNCDIGLPNAIFYSNGFIWFSEHYAGRIAKYDPNTGTLIEYVVPATTKYVYAWWAAPGTNNLVWFTAFGLDVIGYVNASIPISIGITASQTRFPVERGGSQHIPLTVTSETAQSITIGIQETTQDSFSQNPALFADSNLITVGGSVGSASANAKLSAAWTATDGPRYVALTATNGQVSVSIHLNAVIVDPVLPYLSLGVVSCIIGGGAALWVKSWKRQHDLQSATFLRKK